MLVVIQFTSIAYVRRIWYRLFKVFHLLLPIPIAVMLCFHSINVGAYLSPALFLYGFDLSIRLYTWTTSKYEFKLTLEDSYVRIDAYGVDTCNTQHGQFYNITINELDPFFSHPFSVALNPSPGHLVLYAKPNASSSESSWVNKLVRLSKTNKFETNYGTMSNRFDIPKFKGLAQGPFMGNLFDFQRFDRVACIVGGSGITAAIMIIQQFTQKYPRRFLYLYWTTRDRDATSVSFFKALLDLHSVYVKIVVYNTSGVPFENDQYVIDGSMDVVGVLADIMTEVQASESLGLFTCGPVLMMQHLEVASSGYRNISVVSEAFYW